MHLHPGEKDEGLEVSHLLQVRKGTGILEGDRGRVTEDSKEGKTLDLDLRQGVIIAEGQDPLLEITGEEDHRATIGVEEDDCPSIKNQFFYEPIFYS